MAGLLGSTRQWVLADDVVHANQGSIGAVTWATLRTVETARRRADANPMGTQARDTTG